MISVRVARVRVVSQRGSSSPSSRPRTTKRKQSDMYGIYTIWHLYRKRPYSAPRLRSLPSVEWIQCVHDGFEYFAEGRLITLFSAPDHKNETIWYVWHLYRIAFIHIAILQPLSLTQPALCWMNSVRAGRVRVLCRGEAHHPLLGPWLLSIYNMMCMMYI